MIDLFVGTLHTLIIHITSKPLDTITVKFPNPPSKKPKGVIGGWLPPNDTCTSLVVYGQPRVFSSGWLEQRLRFDQLALLIPTFFQISVIVGLVLSDAYMERRSGWNTVMELKQSLINIRFLLYCFFILGSLTTAFPTMYGVLQSLHGNTPKWYYTAKFKTRGLASLNFIYALFYQVVDGRLVKQISPLLFDYMNYVSLAFWIMGDGAAYNNGIRLCTENFSLMDQIRLMNMMRIKFQISPTLHVQGNGWRIGINREDSLKLLPHIRPYFVDSMLYKLENIR